MGVSDKIELQLSPYIKHRSELMKSLKIPKLSDAKATLGDSLAKIVFDQCDESLKEDFGLKPPLKGAFKELWNSPSDLLRGKIALTPPYTRKYVQALTHQGILDIGAGIEEKFMHEAELIKESALAHQKKEMLDSFQDNIMAEIKDVEARERASCQREIEKLMNEFQVVLEDELKKLEDSLREEYNSIIESQEQTLQAKWEENLERKVEITVQTLTKEFLEEMRKQEEILAKEFKLELSKMEMQKHYDIGMEKAQYEEKIKQLIHKLECKNIANLMCMLCMERRKCLVEKNAIENYYKSEISLLEKRVGEKCNKVKVLTRKLIESKKETSLRETCILEIIKQYQKFINFVLKSAPTQAEFLLSIEKLMVFELTDNILNTPEKTITQCETTLKWKPPSEVKKSSANLELKDGHNCMNEIPLPSPDDILPGFKYKDKLYIREEFRDILSNLDQNKFSGDIWINNEKDVELLVAALKESVKIDDIQSTTEQLSKTLYFKEHSHSELKQTSECIQEQPKRKSQDSNQRHGKSTISIQFKQTCERIGDQVPNSIQYNSKSRDISGKISTKKTLKCSDISENLINYKDIGSFENKAVLLGTRNSLELIKEKYHIKENDSTDQNDKNNDGKVDYELDELINITGDKRMRMPSYESLRINTDKNETEIRSSLKKAVKEDSDQLKGMSHLKDQTVANLKLSPEDALKIKETLNIGLKNQLSVTSPKDSAELERFSKNRSKMSSVGKTKPHETKESTKNGRSLALETRDSLIVTKMSQMKFPSFTIPRDSLEMKQESFLGIKQHPSKIASARDSIELARLSMNKAKLFPDCKSKSQTTKESIIRSGSKRTSTSIVCSGKCPRTKQSIEVMDGIISKRVQEDFDRPSEMGRSSLRISHFDVISVPDNSKSVVLFECLPNKIVDDESNIIKVHKPYNKEQSRVMKKSKSNAKYAKKPVAAAVVGNLNAKEYLQTTKQFTDDRIRSFISLIKDHPNLIRLFTACQK